MRCPDLDADPPLHHPHPPGDFKTPTACASTRLVRTASAGVSYAVVWPVAAAAPTRSRAAWWHLLLLQGGYRDAQRPKLTQTLLCCSLGVPWHLVVHVDCSGHPCSQLGACTCCGQGWRCVTANGAAGAAQCELFQCLCAQPPSRAGSPGGTYTMCESKIHTKVTRRVCCGLFWKYGRFTPIERFLTVDIDRSS